LKEKNPTFHQKTHHIIHGFVKRGRVFRLSVNSPTTTTKYGVHQTKPSIIAVAAPVPSQTKLFCIE
jgi:hypothetical protein